jgi:hypothetical protein
VSGTADHSEEVFIEAVRKTFSDLAFIDVTVIPKPANDPDSAQLIHISFLEPHPGEIVLFLPCECKKMIVENIYGEDWKGLPSDRIYDCLLELLNVLGGNFLSDLYCIGMRPDMSLPTLLFDNHEIHDTGNLTNLYFDAETSIFKASLRFNDSAQAL